MTISERRAEKRLRTYLGGQVVFNRRQSIYDCLIRNLSEGGARLVFAQPAMIPGAFELVINRGGESRWAEIRWRTRLAAGVSFASGASPAFVSLQATRRIRQLEGERAALKARVAELSEP
ncbi:MAG: PilZ domain-containing protein [Methylobacteriaceae bacterium]|nr:PilZ domain-containing protein [Methylobacteriaceae bacterium]